MAQKLVECQTLCSDCTYVIQNAFEPVNCDEKYENLKKTKNMF